MGQASQWPFL